MLEYLFPQDEDDGEEGDDFPLNSDLIEMSETNSTEGSPDNEHMAVEEEDNDAVIDQRVYDILENFEHEMEDEFYNSVMQGFD